MRMRPRAFQLAAASWYDNVFLPVIEVVRQVDVLKHFPGRSESDLYIWLVRNQAALREQHNLGELDLPSAARFWQAYVDRSSTKPNLEDVDLPRAVKEFLRSVGE